MVTASSLAQIIEPLQGFSGLVMADLRRHYMICGLSAARLQTRKKLICKELSSFR